MLNDVYDLGGNDPLGFVVIVFNQASRQPDVLDGSFNTDLEHCRHVADDERRKTTEHGRRETHTIAAVVELDGELRA